MRQKFQRISIFYVPKCDSIARTYHIPQDTGKDMYLPAPEDNDVRKGKDYAASGNGVEVEQEKNPNKFTSSGLYNYKNLRSVYILHSILTGMWWIFS